MIQINLEIVGCWYNLYWHEDTWYSTHPSSS